MTHPSHPSDATPITGVLMTLAISIVASVAIAAFCAFAVHFNPFNAFNFVISIMFAYSLGNGISSLAHFYRIRNNTVIVAVSLIVFAFAYITYWLIYISIVLVSFDDNVSPVDLLLIFELAAGLARIPGAALEWVFTINENGVLLVGWEDHWDIRFGRRQEALARGIPLALLWLTEAVLLCSQAVLGSIEPPRRERRTKTKEKDLSIPSPSHLSDAASITGVLMTLAISIFAGAVIAVFCAFAAHYNPFSAFNFLVSIMFASFLGGCIFRLVHFYHIRNNTVVIAVSLIALASAYIVYWLVYISIVVVSFDDSVSPFNPLLIFELVANLARTPGVALEWVFTINENGMLLTNWSNEGRRPEVLVRVSGIPLALLWLTEAVFICYQTIQHSTAPPRRKRRTKTKEKDLPTS